MNEQGQEGAGQGAGTIPPAAGGEGAGQPGVDVPQENRSGRKRGPHPEAGKYVVLAAAPVTREPEGEEKAEPTPGPFAVVAKVQADSQPEAKKKAIAGNEELQSRVTGEGIFLAAVPAASWQPKLAKAETQTVYEGL